MPLGSWAKVGRERGGHGPKTALKPQPLFEWGWLLVHYSAFPSSCRQKGDMWKCVLVSFLTRLFLSFFFFFHRHHSLSVREWKPELDKKKNSGISNFFIILLLFGPWYSSLYWNLHLFESVALLHSFFCRLPHWTHFCFVCTKHSIAISINSVWFCLNEKNGMLFYNNVLCLHDLIMTKVFQHCFFSEKSFKFVLYI